jgi:N-acetylglucosamine-6-phosphate deacetylase
MSDILISAGKLILPDRIYEAGDVLVRDGKIAVVGRNIKPGAARIIDARGMYVAPGLIDTHIHGAMGHMSETATLDGMKEISMVLARFGTTAFLPTVGALPEDVTQKALTVIAESKPLVGGAEIVGIHMEGPYLNPERAGAQNLDFLRTYKAGELKEYVDASKGILKIMSLAPEIPGGMKLIEELGAHGIIAGAVHTDATFADAVEASSRGLCLSCHTFNAMRPIHHREPGIVTFALLSDSLFSEFVADGFHLDLPILEMAYRMKGPDKMILVSDSVGALGLPEGDYEFFGVPCTVAGGKVMLTGTDYLAGSASPLIAGVRNLYKNTSIGLPHIFRAASQNPATLLRIDDRLGSIMVGKDAHLLILNEDLDIITVLIGGKEVSL